MKPLKFVFFIAMLIATFSVSAVQETVEKERKKAVLVTGSSSGIGLRMTQELSTNGFYVYAGVLHKHEMEAMNKMDNVTAVQFDVRKQDEIDAAVKFVEAQGRGLYGLINNAGVAIFGPMLELPVEQLQYQMDVNVYGPFRVTQAFGPLIMQSKGRIATTGSIAGILSPAFMGAYSMSKHSIEAYTDALAQEMARFDVSVHVIEPGSYGTNIGNVAKARLLESNYWSDNSQYRQERDVFLGLLEKSSKDPDPIDVAKAALHIMLSDSPKNRYLVTSNSGQSEETVRRQISKMLELNNGQVHQFGRTRLIEMLDEELVKNPIQK